MADREETMILSESGAAGSHGQYQDVLTPGIPDTEFIRGKVPMTKEEIRILALCKLHLTPGAVLYDIGSGTGSIAVEAARLPGMAQSGGVVYAIEENPEAITLIRRNAEKFRTGNVHVVEGHAPEAIRAEKLPAPTHVFIGGTKGKISGILAVLSELNPHVRVVMTAVTLETIRDMQNVLEEYGIKDAEIISVSVSRAAKMGSYHLMQANNTVYIASFRLAEQLTE